MTESTDQSVTDALRRAFVLGQTYWQQADSEYTSQHRKADATRSKFQELCERTEDTIDTLRAENERLRACFDWANGAAEEGWLPAQEVRKLRAQLAEAQRDSERLDWLDKHCTGASDSERYLPRKIYWGGGSHRDVRAAIDAAKGGVK